MNVQSASTSAVRFEGDALVVGVASDEPLIGAAQEINTASGGLLERLLARKEITGKPYEVTLLHDVPGVAAPLVAVVGLGPREKIDRAVAYRAAGAASRALAAKPRRIIGFALDRFTSDETLVQAVAGSLVGCVGQDLYREQRSRHPFERLVWLTSHDESVQRGVALGESINLTRRLVNEPPQVLYPETFVERAEVVARGCGLELEIWDEQRLTVERCGSLLAVAKGSARPPRLAILTHSGGAPTAPRLALVGKGVTFDSGGLSLKPNEGMLSMKCDMAGAATVLGAMQAIAQWKLPINVVGLVGLVENMPSGTAMKLGDVLHARSGRTIEVQNTDAEGRLVLADVLNVAVERGASRIIDLATLTGACLVALGADVAGIMANDDGWSAQVAETARDCGEPAWPLPMFADHRWADYREMINSQVADIRNVGEGRNGGAITAAKFLEEFVAGVPWVHLDIAGPAFSDKPKPWVDGGGSGAFVRTLVEMARRLA